MTRVQRLTRLEARWRPAHIAAVLTCVRACPEVDRGACLLAELTAVDRATCEAIIEKLTDAENAALDALIGLETLAFMDSLPEAKRDAFLRGESAATRLVLRAWQHHGDVYPLPAIPAEPPSPVITGSAELAFRKH